MAKTKSAPPLSFSMEDEVVKIFNKFDKNGDGRISSGELRDILRALGSETTEDEVNRIMAELDKDGDGFIDMEEFAAFHCGGGDDGGDAKCGNKELRDAFDLYDLDKNGKISSMELHSVLRSLGEKCSLKDCKKMIGSVDKDGDGCVNFEEFKKMMTKSPAKA